MRFAYHYKLRRAGSFWLFVYLWESARFLCTDWCDRIQSSQVILITVESAISQTGTIALAMGVDG
ncbi:MAG: hypothetical protein ABI262_09605 [Microcoleus sp.]|jgi:hypothetical protein